MTSIGRYRKIASRADQLADLLEQMRVKAPDIEASALVSCDGLLIAAVLPRDWDEDLVSAMSAAMASLGSRIVEELSRGDLDQVFVDGDKGSSVMMAVGDAAVLTTLTRPEAQLGLVLVVMRNTIARLIELLYTDDH